MTLIIILAGWLDIYSRFKRGKQSLKATREFTVTKFILTCINRQHTKSFLLSTEKVVVDNDIMMTCGRD